MAFYWSAHEITMISSYQSSALLEIYEQSAVVPEGKV